MTEAFVDSNYWREELKRRAEDDTKKARDIAMEAFEIEPSGYINHYECEECHVSWDDEWSCMCDDDCPECGHSYTPYDSDPIYPDEINEE